MLKYQASIRYSLLLVASFLAMLIAMSNAPLFENDYYRYFWDASLVNQNENPYTPPIQSPMISQFESTYGALDYKNYGSIYQAIPQIIFLLAYKISLSNFPLFKIMLAFIYIISFGLYLHFQKLSKQEKLIWLINPLFLNESVNSLHFDILVGLALISSFNASHSGSSITWSSIALSIKVGPFLRLFDLSLWKHHFLKKIIIITIASAIPWFFIGHFTDWIHSFLKFGTDWEMNSGWFRWLNSSPELSLFFSKKFVFILNLLILFCFSLWLKKRNLWKFNNQMSWFWLLFLFLILSPIVNPWYFLWILPLLIKSNQKLIMPGLINLIPLAGTYSFFYYKDNTTFTLIWTLEHILLWIGFAYGLCTLKSLAYSK